HWPVVKGFGGAKVTHKSRRSITQWTLLLNSKRKAQPFSLVLAVLGHGQGKIQSDGNLSQHRQHDPDAGADAHSNCTEFAIGLNRAHIGEHDAAHGISKERIADLRGARDRPIAADRIVFRYLARADAAEAEAAHRSDAAGVKSLEEWRRPPDPSGVGMELEHRLAIEQVFVEQLERIEGSGEFLEGEITTHQAITFPTDTCISPTIGQYAVIGRVVAKLQCDACQWAIPGKIEHLLGSFGRVLDVMHIDFLRAEGQQGRVFQTESFSKRCAPADVGFSPV